MFPLRDHNPSHKTPFITYGLIGINILVFLFQLTTARPNAFIETYALIPVTVNFFDATSLFPFITSMFLHGGWFHLLSNMWFLWIFGDNIEARLHNVPFLLFYIVSGITGSLLQYAFAPLSSIPVLGASGAIAGVLGAYLVLFPHAQIETFVMYFGFFRRINISAKIMLVYWIATQILSGVGAAAAGALAGGGVAWFAHIGGFAAGYTVARQLKKRSEWYRIQ